MFVPKWKDNHGVLWGFVLRPAASVLAAMGHVNMGSSHMPSGPRDHLGYLRRLAARGERDES